MKSTISILTLILSLFLPLNVLASPEVVRGPYLQKATPTSMIVRWRTNEATDSSVRFGTSRNRINKKVTINESTTEHRVEIKNLKPLTRYFYTIGSSQGSLIKANSEMYFTTHPSVGKEVSTRIWALGDSGRATLGQKQVYKGYLNFAKKTNKRANLWLMLGDNAYESGKDEEYKVGLFDAYTKTLRNTVLWPTFGNHDGLSANSQNLSGPYYDNFSLPRNAESGGLASNTEAYYSFDYGQIHFINLNSNDIDRSSNGQMANWLKNDLNSSKLRWKIVYWHHPPYSKSSHDSDTEIELIEMRQNIVPILEQANVDLVLSGHSHTYERSMLIHGHYGDSKSLNSTMIIDSNSGDNPPYTKKSNGTVYLVAGNGATIASGSLNHPAIKVSSTALGSVVIDVYKNKLSSSLIDVNGNVLDRFVIVK